jgi:cell wall-associated NlpC family hydrolase
MKSALPLGGPLDPRRHAYRGDLAAEALRGVVAAARYAPGALRQVAHCAAPLHANPDAGSAWTTQALMGELVRVYDEQEGWAWGQLQQDSYVGYLRAAALSAGVRQLTHRVAALGTTLYPAADVKAPPLAHLSMNASVSIAAMGDPFARLAEGGFVPARHLRELGSFASDFVAVAESFRGVPYLWGGKTRQGVDCSGLLQLALQASGQACPRDSDMQLALGRDIPLREGFAGLARGDLVFWAGHVGIMIDAFQLLHANAYHMAVVVEPLRLAAERIAGSGVALLHIKRLPGRPA